MIPSIFVSSTISDLRYLRDALKDAIADLAYHSVMSERGEVGYLNPSTAAESCYRSVRQCQMAIIIVGRRYGSPSEDGISVTHKEFRAAREAGIPVIAFVESEVLSYRDVYRADPEAQTWANFDQMDHPGFTFGLIEEITQASSYNGLIPFTSAAEAKMALKLQIADFVGNSLAGVISPMSSDIKGVLAEIAALRHQLSPGGSLDPDFMTALRFVIDDRVNKGLRSLIEYTTGAVDKAVPLLLDSSTFDEFMQKSGCSVRIQNDYDLHTAPLPPSGFVGSMEFGAPDESGNGYQTAEFTAFHDGTVIMNEVAKRHFDWIVGELHRHVGSKPTGTSPLNEE